MRPAVKRIPLFFILGTAALAAILFFLACARPPQADAEQEVRTLEQKWNDALVKRDITFLEGIIADDYLFTT
jgi:hypothetical protein